MTATATVQEIIARPLRFLRGPIARGFAASLPISTPTEDATAAASTTEALPVDRTGGDQGAGIIHGFALCTVGEALGHGHWCDAVMLQQIVDLGNAKTNGIKARFTHPGLSSDGLGSFLGRAKNLTLQGEVVRGDLHFDKTAHVTPDGDLAAYAMGLAESDPEAFGSSIVFMHDRASEEQFQLDNGGEWNSYDGYRVIVNFESPDPRNTNHYPHCRIAELRAVDVVDEPAANPDGLFHIPSDTLAEANEFMAYALGLSDDQPRGELAAQINPDRARGFAARFLNEKGLSICPTEKPMSTETKPVTPPEKPTQLSEGDIRKQLQAEAQKYAAKFGAQGATWFAEGVSWDDAHEKFAASQVAKITALTQERDDAVTALAALDRGEKTPVETGDPGSGTSYAAVIAARNAKK